MKLLIVDDEKHARDAIRLLVPWGNFGIHSIFEAPDGQAAIETITAEMPEIIITDMMMPVTNGAQLLEWIHSHAPSSKTIVISGHDDFALLRHTVKYGGTDYILKPIDAEQLNESLSKAVQTWRKEEETRLLAMEQNIEMNQIKPFYWDKLLSHLIDEPAQYDSFAEQLHKELAVPCNIKSVRTAILSLDTLERSLKDKFATNSELLFFSLINICNEFLNAQHRGIAFRQWNKEHEIVLLFWTEPERAGSLLAEINEGLKITLRSRLNFGLGECQPFPGGIKISYQEARQALQQRNLLLKTNWIHTTDSKPLPSAKKTIQFSDYEERIRLAIRSGSLEHIHAAIQIWIDHVKQLDRITVEQLSHWWHEFNVMKRRWVDDFFPHKEEVPNIQMLIDPSHLIVPLDEDGVFSFALWQQELTRSIIQLANAVSENQQKVHNSIFDIARYIENNYHQDITLQDIASRFYLSREYISRKFKQEFKVNLSDYLTTIRINKAKLLLENPHLRIAQLSEMVGYKDEKYFSKVFKKSEGVSPNEFRKQM